MINQSVAGDIKGVSRKVVTAVIALVLVLVISASTVLANAVTKYKVTIKIDQNSYTITTDQEQPLQILAKSNIACFDTDKIDISGFKAGKGGVIKIDRQKTVNIKYGKNIKSYKVYADTVAGAAKELGLSLNNNSKLNYSLSSYVVEGMVINIKKADSVTLDVDGKKIEYPIVSGKVSDLVKLSQIKLGSEDYVTPSMSTALKKGMTVKVNRVTYKTVSQTETVQYSTTEVKNTSVYQGIEKITSAGQNGTDKVTYKVKCVNGQETTKQVVSRQTIKKVVNQVVSVGAKATKGNTNVKANGVTTSSSGYTVGQTLTGNYTHYCACGRCGSGTGRTASGKKVWNGMKNPYYIACNWLPLGSVVNIDGTNYTVVDRGGSGLSRSGRVDIFTPEGHQACFRYGRGSCTLTIIRIGW